ncbi:MAG: hypothetical protein ACRESU_06215 [Gammaproteobacteria bacterium]
MTTSAIQLKRIIRPAIGTGLILLIPLIMTIIDSGKAEGDGWHWGLGDFIIMGALLFCAGLMYEFLASKIDKKAYRVAIGIAIAFLVLAIWVQLAVDGVSQIIKFLFG